MRNEIDQWREKEYIPCMRKYGVKEGDTVVDFGCSVGNYSFPLAELVGDNGKVYAVDNDPYALGEVNALNQNYDMNNIYTMIPEKDYKLFMSDESANAFVLYDLFHMLKSNGMLDKVVSESRRVLKEGALFSVLPFHMSKAEIRNMIGYMEKNHFEFIGIQKETGLHFEMQRYHSYATDWTDNYERGDIYQFRKVS